MISFNVRPEDRAHYQHELPQLAGLIYDNIIAEFGVLIRAFSMERVGTDKCVAVDATGVADYDSTKRVERGG